MSGWMFCVGGWVAFVLFFALMREPTNIANDLLVFV